MTSLADRLAAIHVTANVSGGDITAELRRQGVRVSFEEGVYDFAGESALAGSLERLAKLLWAGWQRQYRAAIDETDLIIDADDQHDLNFFADRSAVTAQGVSADGRITISTIGMESFSVQIQPGTVRAVPESSFRAGAEQAAVALIRDYRDKVNELKKRYYG